jgi:transposase
MPGRHRQYPPELREREVRLVAECRPDHASEWDAMRSVAQKLGIGTTETVRTWVRRAEVDAGARPGVTSEESAELRRLKAEVKELRRANEILKAAAVSSRSSSTGHTGSREVRGRARRPAHGRRAALGGRADLPSAHRARNADRPQHLLRRPHPTV